MNSMRKYPDGVTPHDHHNYVGFFLTFACNLNCPYCINCHGQGRPIQKSMEPGEWIEAANRLVLRDDLPLTLQGGEPTLYKGFYRLVNEVREEIKMDLMTNMMFEVTEFIRNVPLWRFNREAPYAPIRVSYHPGQNTIDDLIRKTLMLQDAGFRVGLYGIEHPDEKMRARILEAQERCLNLGIDFRTKEFLGSHGGRSYGTFKYHGSVDGAHLKHCDCKTTEILIDPSGYAYRCHSDLYKGRNPIGHILEPGFTEESIEIFRSCDYYGDCNPCDVKVKTNRFQILGHTSVEIRNIR
jgi:hypothetical protein